MLPIDHACEMRWLRLGRGVTAAERVHLKSFIPTLRRMAKQRAKCDVWVL